MLIELNLYDAQDEVVKTLRKTGVRWEILKKATKLRQEAATDGGSDLMDGVVAIIADLFAGQATADEIERGANADELLVCWMQIITSSSASVKQNFLKASAAK